MLPKIAIGGDIFWDMSPIISPDRYQRYDTIGIALHHSVGAADFPDRNWNGTTMDEEIEHIRAIEAQHLAQDFGGFGYNAIAFASGRVYVAGRCMGARAHVAGRNGELEGICMAGDYRTLRPAQALIAAVARYYRARVNVLGVKPIEGHRDWALPGNETTCPGDAGLNAVIGAIYAHTVAQEVGMTEQEIREIVDLAIQAQVRAPLEDGAFLWQQGIEGRVSNVERVTSGLGGSFNIHIANHGMSGVFGPGLPPADLNPFDNDANT